MPKIQIDGLKLHYWQSGAGSDLILVHGLGGNLAGWHLSMVPQLQSQYRVTTYDLRGHGKSDVPAAGYTTLEMAQDLLGLMDALDIDQAHILGHSWGGDVVLHFSLLHPERVSSLTVVEAGLLAPLADVYRSPDWDGWPYATKTLETLTGQPIPEQHRFDLEYLLKLLLEVPVMFGPAKGRPREEGIINRVWDILTPMWEGNDFGNSLELEQLAHIVAPTLLLYEQNSTFHGACDVLKQRLPNKTSIMLPRSDLKHFTGLAHPDLILKHATTFWALWETELRRAVGQD